jgi:hypothetical protein
MTAILMLHVYELFGRISSKSSAEDPGKHHFELLNLIISNKIYGIK